MKFSKTAGSVLSLLFSFSLAIAQTSRPTNPPASGMGSGQGSSATSGNPGQLPPGASSQAKPANAPPPESVVPSTASVITIEGVCDTPAPSLAKPAKTQAPQSCRTEVSRADFERLLGTVAPPNPSPEIRKSVANTYARLLTMAKQADKQALDKDPKFQEQLEIIKLQLKAQMAERALNAEAANVSDADLKTYYDSNSSAYEEATLDRIFIPKSGEGANSSSPAAGADPKQIAEQARQQLQKGDDPAKVQAAVFQQLNSKAEAPPTKREHVRRGTSLPPTDEPKVFALKPGEVSEVLSDPVGYMVYKMDEKKSLPFESVKNDIKTTLVGQRMKDRMESIMNSAKTQLNDSYFGATQQSQSANPSQGDQVRALSDTQTSPKPSTQKSATPANKGTSTAPKASTAPKK